MLTRRVSRVVASWPRASLVARRGFLSSTMEGEPQQEEHLQHWRYLRNSGNGAELFLVGTCHASADSANAVKEVTLREVKKNLSLLEITNFVMGLPQHAKNYPALFENATQIDSMKSIEALLSNKRFLQQTFQLLEDHFPGAMKAILHDRNELMTQKLREMEGRIVAVVGLAHMEGMQKLWHEAEP